MEKKSDMPQEKRNIFFKSLFSPIKICTYFYENTNRATFLESYKCILYPTPEVEKCFLLRDPEITYLLQKN